MEVKEVLSNRPNVEKQLWISELDLCFVSLPLVSAISHFTVLEIPLGSRPVSVGFDFSCCINTCKVDELVERSKMLGSYEPHVEQQPHEETDSIYRFIERNYSPRTSRISLPPWLMETMLTHSSITLLTPYTIALQVVNGQLLTTMKTERFRQTDGNALSLPKIVEHC